MKILEAQSATLSNPEVLSHLNFLSARRQTTKPPSATAPPLKSANYETVVKELTDYLSPTSSSRSPLPHYNPPAYIPAKIRSLVLRLKPYNLTKAELLMITNLKPQDLGFLDCVVEECDLRFSQEEQEEILRVVGECFGGEGEGEGMEVDEVRGVNGGQREDGEDGGKEGNGEVEQPVEMDADGGKAPDEKG